MAFGGMGDELVPWGIFLLLVGLVFLAESYRRRVNLDADRGN